MDFGIPEASERLRAELRGLLRSDPVAAELARLAGLPRGHEESELRPLYRLLGEAGVLAVAWPAEHGGRGGGPTDQLVLAEELVRHDVPLPLHSLTIQIVGAFLLAAGSDEQRRRLLPAMARGELLACVLFTEPDAGSDLTALATAAERLDGGGWAISGRKRFSMGASAADVGLCAARTDPAASPYQGIGLFLVPMGDPAVRVRRLDSLPDEAFHEVELDGVRVGDDALVGGPGDGWALIGRMLAGERNGLNYYARGLRWLEDARRRLGAAGEPPADSTLEGLGRHWARLEAGRWLAVRVLQALHEGAPDVTLSALAKWHCSEAAQRAAWWALETLGPAAALREDGAALEAALREAPGATLSAGASEVLLDALAGSGLEAFG